MITVAKLSSLPPKTRLRKTVTLIEEWERNLQHGVSADSDYQRRVMKMLLEDASSRLDPWRELITKILVHLDYPSSNVPYAARNETESVLLLREFQHLRYGLMNSLGITAADWDFYNPETGRLERPRHLLLPISLYLDDIRSPYNVGSIFRTAEAFGVREIFLSRYTASPAHKRAVRTSMGCTEVLPWQESDLESLSDDLPVIALELGGEPINEFHFPPQGIVVIGSEELGISPEARRIALNSGGVVTIPLRGAKGSLNVAVATGILLQTWVSNLSAYQPEQTPEQLSKRTDPHLRKPK